MKKVIIEKYEGIISEQPLCCIVGHNEVIKTRFIEEILQDEELFSKKYGRIIYVGERKYKHGIEQDQENTIEFPTSEMMKKQLAKEKEDSIKNLLFVFNSKNISEMMPIIEEILEIRMTFLKGIISFLINVSEIDEISEKIWKCVSNLFIFETSEVSKIEKHFQLKGLEADIQNKKKKECILVGKKRKVEIK